MTNAAFKKKKSLFIRKLELKISKKLVKGYICSINLVWCWNFDTSRFSSETTGAFWKMVLEKDGEDQVDQSDEKLSNV